MDTAWSSNVHKAEVLRKGDEIGTYPDRNHPLRQKNPNSGQPDQLDTWDEVIKRADAYPNSKGFVIVHRDDGSSHVMNVIKDGDGVAFVDGQFGKLGKLDDNPRNLEYFRYDPPGRQAGGISLNGPAVRRRHRRRSTRRHRRPHRYPRAVARQTTCRRSTGTG
ncbi:toxin glutamine deamidase domain-containing protein [Amycolatopsis sp. FDAARGOS 1241]|uniref:toxin glutamine deamidase domain-containing protein n=1 Tax=Amycolatopsis sp. FDAARGOS 1241 TaxID=2778070 RepID=UPI00194DDA61|nr:toxin glutamine deamidase domain-containing protein [Amycolatopsis sp. FDAARGOS 1241]QRP48056.1 hypothetical protein I6J71_09305 [Amycolatopsis sp. FDAARGOS 1241]